MTTFKCLDCELIVEKIPKYRKDNECSDESGEIVYDIQHHFRPTSVEGKK